jgi:hypothetical protein
VASAASVNENIPEKPGSEYALPLVVPPVVLVTDRRKFAGSTPPGAPGTPENEKFAVPDAETVVVTPVTEMETRVWPIVYIRVANCLYRCSQWVAAVQAVWRGSSAEPLP